MPSSNRDPHVTADISYDPKLFSPIAAAEDDHFWFRARRRVLETLLRQLAPTLPTQSVLEIGCGTGNVTRTLVDVFGADAVTAMEPHGNAVEIARRRLTCRVVEGDLAAPPIAGPFGLVGMFDVLEHLPDEAAALGSVFQLVAPGGVFLLTVPARQSLWSYFDETSGHFRRYEVEGLRDALERARFRVEYVTEFFSLLFPMMWLGRRIAGLRRGDAERERAKVAAELRSPPLVNDALAWVLGLEARRVGARRSAPFGTSIVAIARRT
ncbi:MAG: class I SAM-dependent methyltransferase [Labilithrix sp.]|nr:class I SAM-dependent methyltransferase [Labilithrix sp.]